MYKGLCSYGINVWMDVYGGVKGNVNDRWNLMIVNLFLNGY